MSARLSPKFLYHEIRWRDMPKPDPKDKPLEPPTGTPEASAAARDAIARKEQTEHDVPPSTKLAMDMAARVLDETVVRTVYVPQTNELRVRVGQKEYPGVWALLAAILSLFPGSVATVTQETLERMQSNAPGRVVMEWDETKRIYRIYLDRS